MLSESSGKFTIFGRPILFSEKLAAVGTKGDIILADLQQYLVGVRADFSLAKSGHLGFQTDTSHYRGIIRVDGQPKLDKPITPYKGLTLSPFITIEDRT